MTPIFNWKRCKFWRLEVTGHDNRTLKIGLYMDNDAEANRLIGLATRTLQQGDRTCQVVGLAKDGFPIHAEIYQFQVVQQANRRPLIYAELWYMGEWPTEEN